MKEIIFAGFGGQGVLTGGLILAYMATGKDLEAVWLPSYGPSMRGGKANSTVKYGEPPDERIGSPAMEDADILIAMNEPALDFLSFCKPDAKVFVNANAVRSDLEYPEGVDVTYVDAVELAAEANNVKGQNLVMLGAVMKKCGLFDIEYTEQRMCKFFADKGKGKFNEANVAALRKGYDAV